MATRPESMMIQGGPKEYKQRAILDARAAQDAIDRWFANNDSPFKGRYQFKELIGKGSYGRVYKSVEIETGRTVAIKVLTPDESDLNIPAEARDTNLQDALKEINILERLRQSRAVNVNQFIEAFTVHSQLWLVSDYCSGGSLSTLKRAAGGKLDEHFIRTVARELASGLASVHKAGIVHRDIKCANVMISESGGVQIIDFGVSAVLMSNMEEDKRKTIIGTPHWMAPELQQAPDKEVPHGSEVDVWAYGITLYECAMGYPPNATITQQARLRALLKQQPPRLPEDRFSADLRDLVATVLNPDPKTRPTMQEICNHPYLLGSEVRYPTTILQNLVETYYNWERGGGHRASLWYAGGAAQAKVNEKPEQDEWVFSTTAAFDRMHGDSDDDGFSLSGSPPRESDEWGEDPSIVRTIRPETGSTEEMAASVAGRAKQDAQARRGEKHLEGLFNQSAPRYEFGAKTSSSDLPLRSRNSGSSLHRKELSVSSNDGTPNIKLDLIDSKKASKRATMAWKWNDNILAKNESHRTSVKRPSVQAQDIYSLGEPVTTKPSNNRETLDLDAMFSGGAGGGAPPSRASMSQGAQRNSVRKTLDLDELFSPDGGMTPGVPPVPAVPESLPSHSQRPSFQDPRKTLDLDELWGNDSSPLTAGLQQALGDPVSFNQLHSAEQTMRPSSQHPVQNIQHQFQGHDFATGPVQPREYHFEDHHQPHHQSHSRDMSQHGRAPVFDFDPMSVNNADLEALMAGDHDYQPSVRAPTDDEVSSLASHDMSNMSMSATHSRNQSASVDGGLSSSPPTSPFGAMLPDHHHHHHHHQLGPHHHHQASAGSSISGLPHLPPYPVPINPAALSDGADKAVHAAEMRRLLSHFGSVLDVALEYLNEAERRAPLVRSNGGAGDDADTESIHGSVNDRDEHDSVQGDDEGLEMRSR